jgi:hypothetical protein
MGIGKQGSGIFDDVWDYDSPYEAFKAFLEWKPEEQPEPGGWSRHAGSNRYRPDGDPAKEYVMED